MNTIKSRVYPAWWTYAAIAAAAVHCLMDTPLVRISAHGVDFCI